jgi:signal transduction histidine kinase
MSHESLSILMLEDSLLDAELAGEHLSRAGIAHIAKRVDTRHDFENALNCHCPDLILSDYALPGFDGLSALDIAQEICPAVPFVFLSGAIGEETAIDSLKRGATDYVLKHRLARLGPAVVRALEQAKERAERKRAQAELAEKARQLELVNSELEQFVYAASHDLREPLRTISIFSDLVTRRYATKLDEDAQTYLNFIASASQHMSHLLEDLLEYAKLPAEDRDFSPVDLNVVFAKVLDLHQSAIRESGANITLEQLPSVCGNQAQISLVVQNLVTNALKYRSERPLKIRVRAERAGGEYVISVADNGKGFEQENADLVFGLFKRLEKDGSPGTGLGLAISKRVIELHGGRIWAESQPDAGATFYFSLKPAEDKDSASHCLSASRQQVPV